MRSFHFGMKSIRLRVLFYFMSLIIVIGIIFTIGINRYIDNYYYGNKIVSMDEVVDTINEIYEDARSEDEALNNIEYLGYTFEGKISILDPTSTYLVYANKTLQFSVGKILQEITYQDMTAYVYETSYPVEGSRWLVYMARLDNDRVAVLQIPVVALDEAISILQAFVERLLIVTLIIAVLFAIFLANGLTIPIRKLHRVAKSIGDLEFDVRYEGKREDEIGQLGRGLNEISEKLKKTIEELQVELKKERNIDKMRRRFVAQVSHELQTPISVISSYTEALTDGIVEDDEMDQYYGVIADESDKMSRIIKDLLELSQLESGAMTFNMQDINVKDFFSNIFRRFELVMQQRGLQFYYEDQLREATYSKMDSLRMEQGVTNLLSNAMKHSDDVVKVQAIENDQEICLRVYNSGEPIPEEDLPHLFESFYKGKQKEKRKEGTGLGLAIAAQIFERHQIRCDVFNEPNGVCFQLIWFKSTRLENKQENSIEN